MPPVGIAPMEFYSYERSKKMNGGKVRSISAITILGMALMTGSTRRPGSLVGHSRQKA